MEKLLTRTEAAKILGISVKTLDAARMNGEITFVQFAENGNVFFTEASLAEYVIRSTHKAKPVNIYTGTTIRKRRDSSGKRQP